MIKTHIPIFTDLDGTLIRTDLLIESALQYLKRNPLNFFTLLLWLFRGRTYLKEQLAQLVDINVEELPYESEVIEYLKKQRSLGRKTILATASHHRYAEQVADHLGVFDGVLATSIDVNLKGKNKLRAIQDSLEDDAFEYIGDGAADRPIWAAATVRGMVNAPRTDIKASFKRDGETFLISTRRPLWRSFIAELRVRQFAKNVLVFVPLFTSHSYSDLVELYTALIAFTAFCICASGVYFLNDLLDLNSDRVHAKKRMRPLASGDLPVSIGVLGAIALPVTAFFISLFFLPILFTVVLLIYYVITTAYTFILKKISTLDVMTLATLYTLRIAGGAAASGIDLSSWLLVFSIFFFLSLAYLKRYIEVAALSEGTVEVRGRGYSAEDKETIFTLGIANATASTLILALYINSTEVIQSYKSPETLWGLCFLLLYWSNRIWVGARRGKIAEDPVVFATTDKISLSIFAVMGAAIMFAKYVG